MKQGQVFIQQMKLQEKSFPNLDPTIRSAVSIARRLQDPLAELVKIEPRFNWCRPVPT